MFSQYENTLANIIALSSDAQLFLFISMSYAFRDGNYLHTAVFLWVRCRGSHGPPDYSPSPTSRRCTVLDRDYFETELPTQIEAAGRPLTVTLILQTGQSFRIRKLGKVGEGYAVLESTHPPSPERYGAVDRRAECA